MLTLRFWTDGGGTVQKLSTKRAVRFRQAETLPIYGDDVVSVSQH